MKKYLLGIFAIGILFASIALIKPSSNAGELTVGPNDGCRRFGCAG